MDTLSWNCPGPGSRFPMVDAGINSSAPLSQVESVSYHPDNGSQSSMSQDLNCTTRTGSMTRTMEQPVMYIPGSNVTMPQLAGQVGSSWNGISSCDPSMQTNPAPSNNPAEPPIINVSEAGPLPSGQDPMAMMNVFGSSSPLCPKQGAHASHVSKSVILGNQEDLSSSMSVYYSPDSAMLSGTPCFSTRQTGPENVLDPTNGVRRQDSSNLKGFLKLDVNMGFMGDGKIDSPTSGLQPVIGWKKRRSVSDVGPRTPSMLGPSMDALPSPIDDLSYLINSMGSRAQTDRPSMNLTHSDEQDSAFNFGSLNLHAEKHPVSHVASQSTASAPGAMDGDGDATSMTQAKSSLQNTLEQAGKSAATLDPSYIPTMMNPTPLVDSSIVDALSSQNLYETTLEDAKEESSTGPIRTCPSGRSSRSVSPYHASTRSLTPESERSLEESAIYDSALRMSQWRFPLSNSQAGHKSDSLHPLDAYGHAVNTSTLTFPGSVRYPGHPRSARRHMRAAISEDFHGRVRVGGISSWGNSLDLTHQGFPLLNHLPTTGDSQVLSPAMVRCASSPGKPSEFQASPAGQVMDIGNISDPNDKLDLERSKNEPQLKPELSSQMVDSSPSRSKVKVEPMDNALQTAAQTHTPVVTTTAAQAASASRRKAEALFTCPFPDCGSTFTRQYNLRGHMRSHMDERPFKCEWPGCGRSFARTHDCKRHHNLHLNIKPYQCESCGKTFARLDALNRHHKSEASTCGAKLHESKPV